MNAPADLSPDKDLYPSNPQRAVTPLAYILFYRRRSDGFLGGEYLAENTTKTINALKDPDAEVEWRNVSGWDTPQSEPEKPSQSSTAQRRDDGQNVEQKEDNQQSDMFGNMFQNEGLTVDNGHEFANLAGLYGQPEDSTWSFGHVADVHDSSQVGPRPDSSNDDNADLFGDNDSTKAVDDNDSDEDLRMASLTDDPVDHGGQPGQSADTPLLDGSVENIPPPLDADDGDDDEMHVVELPPPEGEKSNA